MFIVPRTYQKISLKHPTCQILDYLPIRYFIFSNIRFNLFFDIQILEESIKDLPPWLLNNVMSITPLKYVNGLNFKLKGFTKIVSIKVLPLLEH